MEEKIPGNPANEQAEIVINSGNRLTIENADHFRRQLRDGLSGARKVVIVFDEDVEMDITALQILCAGCKTAAAEGRTLSRGGQRPKGMRDLLDACGARLPGGACKHSNENICIWFGEGE